MNTDIEKFIEFYAQFGINLKVEKWANGIEYIEISTSTGCYGDSWVSYKIIFDENGKFNRQEIDG